MLPTLRRILACALLFGPALSFTAAPAAAQDAPARPRLGLALGGGSARGLAHIGVLRWFEEHRIPVDVVVGTSMGGLVGGGWASGMDAGEIEALMAGTDWDRMFLGQAPFEAKTFRRKEDARAFPSQLVFGLKRGLRLPSGLNSGQYVQLLLDRMALAYGELESFDDLPTRFRSVAADLNTSTVIVLGSGSLARALRATMSLPGIFSPVVGDGQALVDGGTLDNVPADIVRDLGATVVIAVDVAPDLESPEPPDTIFGVLGASLDTMMIAMTREALKAADLVVDPDLTGFGSLDWRRSPELIARGYQAAVARADELSRYQVSEAEYDAWRAERARRRRATPSEIAFVRVEGVPGRDAERIRRRFVADLVNRPLDLDAIEAQILTLVGTERYEIISYHLVRDSGRTGLGIAITPKPYGPPFLLPAFELQNTQSNVFTANLRLRLAFYDALVAGSELRVDAGAGTNRGAGIELYQRLGPSPLFVAPRAAVSLRTITAFEGDERVADYRDRRAGVGADVGVALGSRSEVRAGFDLVSVRLRRRVGSPVLPEADGVNRFASLSWTFDGQDAAVIPSGGLFATTSLRRYFETPEVAGAALPLPAVERLMQGEARLTLFGRWFGRERVFVRLDGGTSFGQEAGVNRFRIGGPLRLSALPNDALQGNHYLLGAAGLLHEWFRLPDLLGGNAYVGGWLESGSAFDRWAAARFQVSFAVGFIMETLVGPVSAAGAFDAAGNRRLYLSLGVFLR